MLSVRQIVLSFLLTTICFVSHGADSLVGKWRCETLTNATVEFLKDGSFHLTAVDHAGGREIFVPMSGSYRIVDTNHIILRIVPAASVAPSNSVPITLSYALSGDELQLQTIDVQWGARTYRRTKR
jgi:hypothetical protein